MEAKEIDEACKIAAEVISYNRYDWPFALFYVPDEDLKRARLVANIGLEPGQTASPPEAELEEDASGPWPNARSFQTNSVQQIDTRGDHWWKQQLPAQSIPVQVGSFAQTP